MNIPNQLVWMKNHPLKAIAFHVEHFNHTNYSEFKIKDMIELCVFFVPPFMSRTILFRLKALQIKANIHNFPKYFLIFVLFSGFKLANCRDMSVTRKRNYNFFLFVCINFNNFKHLFVIRVFKLWLSILCIFDYDDIEKQTKVRIQNFLLLPSSVCVFKNGKTCVFCC